MFDIMCSDEQQQLVRTKFLTQQQKRLDGAVPSEEELDEDRFDNLIADEDGLNEDLATDLAANLIISVSTG